MSIEALCGSSPCHLVPYLEALAHGVAIRGGGEPVTTQSGGGGVCPVKARGCACDESGTPRKRWISRSRH